MAGAAQLSVTIDAPVERVWQAMVDVAAWVASPSITRVERLDDGPLRAGSRTRIEQPGMPPIVWEVTSLDPGVEFTWVGRSLGVSTTGTHRLDRTGTATTLTLTVEHRGPLAGIAAALTRKRTMRYLNLEAETVKTSSESTAAPQ